MTLRGDILRTAPFPGWSERSPKIGHIGMRERRTNEPKPEPLVQSPFISRVQQKATIMRNSNKLVFAIAIAGATAIIAPASGAPVKISASPVVEQLPTIYDMGIGDIPVTVLSDGTVSQDLHKILRRTTIASIDALLARRFQVNPVELSVNAFLIRLPGKLVLVDTGAGQLFAPAAGKLIAALERAGVQPGQITDVLITHAHSDHSGGLVKDGQRVFVNATVHVGKPDVDFFFDDGNQVRTGYDKFYFDVARQTLQPYLDAGKLSTFSERKMILPGITGEVHPGHTPGSALFTLESKGERLVFVGDMIHVADVQFPDPAVTIAYDQDEDGAARARAETFAAFARSGDLIAGPHLQFPGVGRLRAAATGGYDWVPVVFTNRAGP